MKRTVILSAGHGGKDPGAVKGKITERDLAIELRKLVANKLTVQGVKVLTDNDFNALEATLKWLVGKFTPNDILLDIHWNSASPKAKGTEIVLPDNPSIVEKDIANSILDGMVHIGFTSRGIKKESQTARKSLAWMRPKAENILMEVCFLSNDDDMKLYNLNKEAVASVIAESIIKNCK